MWGVAGEGTCGVDQLQWCVVQITTPMQSRGPFHFGESSGRIIAVRSDSLVSWPPERRAWVLPRSWAASAQRGHHLVSEQQQPVKEWLSTTKRAQLDGSAQWCVVLCACACFVPTFTLHGQSCVSSIVNAASLACECVLQHTFLTRQITASICSWFRVF